MAMDYKKSVSIGIVGAGRVGSNLAYRLSRGGWKIKTVFSATHAKAQALAYAVPTGVAPDLESVFKKCDAVFLTVPDRQIVPLCTKISYLEHVKTKYIFHCSGITPSSVMAIAGDEYKLASIHPFSPIPLLNRDKNVFANIFFGVEGDSDALPLAKEIVESLGGNFHRIDPSQKVAYHAAGSFGASFVNIMASIAAELLQSAGIDEQSARAAVCTMVKNVADNFATFGFVAAHTGPITRGDFDTIAKHLTALDKPHIKNLYIAAIRAAAETIGADMHALNEVIGE
jgi:predicted short-subunit dehydrogenase-like oxidoreductase (DUF2520 family)